MSLVDFLGGAKARLSSGFRLLSVPHAWLLLPATESLGEQKREPRLHFGRVDFTLPIWRRSDRGKGKAR